MLSEVNSKDYERPPDLARMGLLARSQTAWDEEGEEERNPTAGEGREEQSLTSGALGFFSENEGETTVFVGCRHGARKQGWNSRRAKGKRCTKAEESLPW